MSNFKNIKFNRITILYTSIIILLSPFLYFLIVFDSINKANSVNFLLYILSLIVLLYAISDIKKSNLNTYNVFLLFYFFALFLNTLNLSSKQFLKTPEDLYYFLLSPFILYSVLYIFEHLKYKSIHIKNKLKFNPNLVYIIILLAYALLKIYIGLKVGFRITNYSDISVIESGTKYTIPGLSGISVIAQWLLVIFIPYVKKRYAMIGILAILFFAGIMNVKRGDVIRVLLFIMAYWVFIKIQFQLFNKKTLIYFLIGIAIFIFIFVMFGEYRTEARGGSSGLIIKYLGSRVDSVVISWLYSYFSFNFEILKLSYSVPPSYEMIHLSEIFGANLDRELAGLTTTISGFNASTFIQPFLIDYGVFYFIEMIIFAILIGIIIFFSKKMNFIGLYIFIIMLMSLMVFGDYFINRSILMSIFVSIFIFPFLRIRTRKGIKW